jgi:hypothetical protein
VELTEPGGEHDLRANRGFGRLAAALLTVSLIGFSMQIWTAFYPTFKIVEIYPAVAWVCLNPNY